MESQFFESNIKIKEVLKRLLESCDFIIEWNQKIISAEDYLTSSAGVQTMAASCMLIESIGEGIKNIDKCNSEFLETNALDIPWRDYVGIRNRIAHGYHELDAEIIFDVSKNEIPVLKVNLLKLLLLI